MTKRKLQWHPGFCAALRIAMQDQMEYLEMQEEHLLSKKPLQMDVLIIKKVQDILSEGRSDPHAAFDRTGTGRD